MTDKAFNPEADKADKAGKAIHPEADKAEMAFRPKADKAVNAAPLQWYAAKTGAQQERKIKQQLDSLGIENFLPLREQVRIVAEKKRKVLRPLIPRLIFLHCRKEQVFPLINEHFLALSFMRNLETKQPLVVPDKQMRDFIYFVDFARDSIQVLNHHLKPGDRVRIVKGELAGVEGELIRIKGHKRVVVRLSGLFSLAANSYLPKHYLEPIVPPTEEKA